MIEKLQGKLSPLTGSQVRIGFATNSIWVVPNLKKEEDREWRIWIDPPWRILKGKVPLMASIDCPQHTNFEDQNEYKKEFHSWCSRIGDPTKTIKSIVVSDGPPDLKIQTEDCIQIEAYVTEIDDYSWYFNDKQEDLSYDATGHGIVIEKQTSEPVGGHNSGGCAPSA